MEKNRTYFKNLLAEHALDILYDELFALMEAHQSGHPDKVIAEKHDELVLLSGKMNSVQQSHQMGTISPGELNIEISRINHALLDLLNELPDAFFEEVQHVDTDVATGVKKQIGIPAGIGKGLFWMGSVLVLMIALGSLVQGNYLTFALTALASLICLPPSFDFMAAQLNVAISNSVRVLFIIVLTSVGLSFAAPAKKDAAVQQPVERKMER